MNTNHAVFASLVIGFALVAASSVFAETDRPEREGQYMKAESRMEVEGRMKPVRIDAGASVEVKTDIQRSLVEAQRETLRAEAEERRKAAEARGDDMEARREAVKLEMQSEREQMDVKREALRLQFEAKRASSTAKRVEIKQDIAKRKVEHVTKVMTATVERLEKITVRIESRIAKFNGAGATTTESEGYIAKAKEDIAKAKVLITAFVSIDISSNSFQENFEAIRSAAAEAREQIRSIHTNLMLAVRSLNASGADDDNNNDDDDDNATTTSSSQ